MPSRNQNLVGKVFGHLTVIKKTEERGTQGEYKWLCQCDCGRTTIVSTGLLNSGEVTSCGHVKLQNLIRYRKHHQETTPGTNLDQLSDKPPVTNKTGYRNISVTRRHGRNRYRVAVVYKKNQYGGLYDSLADAIEARDRLREKLWPNFRPHK